MRTTEAISTRSAGAAGRPERSRGWLARVRTIRSRLVRLLLTLAMMTGLMLFPLAGPALADAYKCNFWGPINVGGWTIPQGQYCAYLGGSGTYVRSIGGNFQVAGSICNYTVTAEFFDQNSRWQRTYVSPMQYGCTGNRQYPVSVWVNSHGTRGGFVCSSLRQSGTRVSSVCFGLY